MSISGMSYEQVFNFAYRDLLVPQLIEVSNQIGRDKFVEILKIANDKVCVWVMPFPPVSVNVYTTDSPNAYFTTDCSASARDFYEDNSTINIYPNPSDDIINIEIEDINNAVIEIYNVRGILIFSKALHSKFEQIDVSYFPEGTYIVKVMQDSAVNVGKLVVQ